MRVIRSAFFFGSFMICTSTYVCLKVAQQVPLPASVETFDGKQLKNLLPDGMKNRFPRLRMAKNQHSVAKQIQIGAIPTSV